MGLKIDNDVAAGLVRAAAADAERGRVDPAWFEKVERLSKLCHEGAPRTHVAFLGTAMIAKAMHLDADLFAIKPSRATGNPKAFSARTPCHNVLVPLAAELGFSIGMTGREPLNDMPYFRMARLGDGTPIRTGGREVFEYILQLVGESQAVSSASEV